MSTLTSTIHYKIEKTTPAVIITRFVYISFFVLWNNLFYLYKYLINRYIFKVFDSNTIALIRVSLYR